MEGDRSAQTVCITLRYLCFAEPVPHRLLPQVGVERDEREGLLEAALRHHHPLRPGVGVQTDGLAGLHPQHSQSPPQAFRQPVSLVVAHPPVLTFDFKLTLCTMYIVHVFANIPVVTQV